MEVEDMEAAEEAAAAAAAEAAIHVVKRDIFHVNVPTPTADLPLFLCSTHHGLIS